MKKISLSIICALLLSCLLSSCLGIDASKEEGGQISTSEVIQNKADGSDTSTADSSDVAHAHKYGEWVTVTEATCRQKGSKARVCSCGEKQIEELEKLACSYVGGVCTMCNGKEQTTAFVPDYSAGQENVIGSDNALLNYTAQAGYVYFSNGNKIQKIKKNTTAVKAVYTVSSGDIYNVNVIGDWIYFFCDAGSTAKSYIAKVRTDGSDFKKLVNSVYVYEMLVVKDTVYYTTVTYDWTYVNYAKDVFPLYSVSTSGGAPKQIHDGAVSDLTADANYLYFSHYTENDSETICRIKHSNLNKSVLLSNKDTRALSLENSKLYFYVVDKYDPENLTIASISINGGSYTTYGKVCCNSSVIHVVGNKVYFVGSKAFSEDDPEPDVGLIEYDLNAKTFKVLRVDYELYEFVGVFDCLIVESYNYSTEKLEYIEIYDTATKAFKKIKVS